MAPWFNYKTDLSSIYSFKNQYYALHITSNLDSLIQKYTLGKLLHLFGTYLFVS